MKQQINLLQTQYRPQSQMLPAGTMLRGTGILLLAMLLIYGLAQHRYGNVEQELAIMASQEAAAIDRLQNVGPLITSMTGETNWAEQLDDSLRLLAERQAVLELIQGSTFGETEGFSRHLRALARQDIDGLWLTHIVLSGFGDKTRLEGRAIRAELIPLYVQDLTAETAFAAQRFNRFQIDNPADDTEIGLRFSMDSDALFAGEASNRP